MGSNGIWPLSRLAAVFVTTEMSKCGEWERGEVEEGKKCAQPLVEVYADRTFHLSFSVSIFPPPFFFQRSSRKVIFASVNRSGPLVHNLGHVSVTPLNERSRRPHLWNG